MERQREEGRKSRKETETSIREIGKEIEKQRGRERGGREKRTKGRGRHRSRDGGRGAAKEEEMQRRK